MIEREAAYSREARAVAVPAGRTLLDMNAYQWTVLFAAWLGWGFDIFDSLLFNYVAPNAVPVLLGIPLGSPAARSATLQWTGILTSLLLVGWAVGGIVFGRIADRLGRTRTLLLTMMMYAIGTAACAFAPNMATLVFFRIIASLGIGGEWAAGAAMVAEVVPEHRRVEAGALLYTAAPVGLFLATIVTYQVQGVYFAGSPEVAWRYVFLFGLLPAAVAFIVRLFVKEPERWKNAASHAAPPRIGELFAPQYRAITISGLLMAVVALITWWSCNAFISVVATGLASEATAGASSEAGHGLGGKLETDRRQLVQHRRAHRHTAHRAGIEVTWDAARCSPSISWPPPCPCLRHLDFRWSLARGCSCISRSACRFSACSGRLPTISPSCIQRACAEPGAGFCYNAGRLIAAPGPFLVGAIASRGAGALGGAVEALFYVGFVPLLGLLVMPWVMETKGADWRTDLDAVRRLHRRLVMDRREFVRLAGSGISAGALAETLVSAQVARTPAAAAKPAASTSKVKFKVGTQQGDSDAILKRWPHSAATTSAARCRPKSSTKSGRSRR